jgi:hypothetical protein
MRILIHHLLSKAVDMVQPIEMFISILFLSKTTAAIQQSGNLSKLNKIVESGE